MTAKASAEVQTDGPEDSGSSPANVDKYMSGMIQEIRRQIRDEFEAKYKAEQTRQDPKKIEADVLARVQESSRRASIEENLILVEAGAQILKEVWEIWSGVIASARGGLDDDITDLILEADSRVHSLALILARLMPAPEKDGKAS